MKLKLLLLSSAVAIAVSSTAFAADMALRGPAYKAPPPPMPYYNWTGLYIGGHFGYGWGTHEASVASDHPFFPIGHRFGASDGKGFLGGGQVGFNYQAGPVVLGAEAQFSWADLEHSPRSDSANLIFKGRYNSDWITTVAARFGFTVQNALIYGKAGAAWVGTESFSETFTGGNVLISTNTGTAKRDGWMGGFGVEYGFTPNWSAKLEYNYIDLGKDQLSLTSVNSAAFGGASSSALRHVDSEIHLLKVGINYRFGFGKSPISANY